MSTVSPVLWATGSTAASGTEAKSRSHWYIRNPAPPEAQLFILITKSGKYASAKVTGIFAISRFRNFALSRFKISTATKI
jgi:hypothetical protein